ncbi:MAG: DNA phosphorothioation system sulfurtransferase DndC [Candidatus Marinimicrobia bacterium]|nr:DNA phosphorothioation system sulfurtransferase DndC [Candidatus Neomarinimicrobiota bacterium]MDA1363924.1 DNA phosphorothioation system sulfurtransferase DndC [Candidatus Neomarinimicrobiota bacterium]
MSESAFKELGLKPSIEEKITELQKQYLADNKPWVIGYSGGKDSTAVAQLTWMAVEQLPKSKRKKPVFIVTTDTMVENPIVSNWVESSLEKMKIAAKENDLPIKPYLIKPKLEDRFWVNLIGKGYPAPRRGFRWCTDRLKIKPSNDFIKSVVNKYGEAILLLGVRSAESSARAKSIKKHTKDNQVLNKHQDLLNCYVYSPIKEWSNDDVWLFLLQYENPWDYSNKSLLNLYQGATEDNECPVVIDTTTPSCGSSRFGCYVCTLVSKDKSMQAMVQNDKDKEWMSPMIKIRDELDFTSKDALQVERASREFTRLNGEVSFYKNNDGDIDTVPGPYKKEKRLKILEKVFKAEVQIAQHFAGGDESKAINLINHEELEEIRRIWIEDKNEVEDELPELYKKIKGSEYVGKSFRNISVLEKDNLEVLESLCDSRKEYEFVRNLLVKEMKLKSKGVRRGFVKELEKELNKFLYLDKEEALAAGNERQELIKSIEITPINDYEGIKI